MNKRIIALASAAILTCSSCLFYSNVNRPFKGEIITQTMQLSLETDNERVDRIIKLVEECKRQEEERLKILEDQRIQREKELALQKEIERKASVTFNPYDVTTPSNLTVEEMYNIYLKTKMRNKWEVAEGVVLAEKETGINALFISSIIALEGDWNNSPRSNGQFNSTGYAVYDRGSAGKTFSSEAECILRTAYLIKEDYLNPKGKYYCEGNSIWNINTKYCLKDDKKTINYRWSIDIDSIAYGLLNKYKR